MKRTNQMRKAISGTGHGNRRVRHGLTDNWVSVPRNLPYPRRIRHYIDMTRRVKINMPKWAVTSSLLDALFYRAGVYEVTPPKYVVA